MPFKLTRRSPLSGKEHTIELPIDEGTFNQAEANRQRGTLIQHAYPMLSDDLREFILTGITPEEWNDAFAEAEEESGEGGPAF